MTNPRVLVFPVLILALAAGVPVSAQSVVSTHSGVVYFFEGSVFIGGEQLVQKVGKFPDIGEGRELRTERGRAEVLLTSGVFLRVAENSAILMLSNKLSDTRIELLGGSAILETDETVPNTSVKVKYQDWQVQVPEKSVYRIDSEPAQLRVYKGEIEVATAGKTETVAVKEGDILPLAAVLVPEHAETAGNDPFKNWAMSRSQVISADNAVAAGIIDDPDKFDTGVAGLPPGLGGGVGPGLGGFSYFPPMGVPSLGLGMNPYGLSFWSPYQPMLSSIYFPPYMFGALYPSWPAASRYFPKRLGVPGTGTGLLRPGGIISPRPIITPTPSHGGVARPGIHGVGHR